MKGRDPPAAAKAAWPPARRVVRDRDGLYAEGVTKGAPQAKLVADGFHLLQNLRKTIEAEF
jgi:transposase